MICDCDYHWDYPFKLIKGGIDGDHFETLLMTSEYINQVPCINTLYESCAYVSRNMAFLCFCVCVTWIIRCHLVCTCARACLGELMGDRVLRACLLLLFWVHCLSSKMPWLSPAITHTHTHLGCHLRSHTTPQLFAVHCIT